METQTDPTSSRNLAGAGRKCRVRWFRRGNAVVETLLATPLVILLTMGMIEFSYFYYMRNVFDGAAREGARAGAPWNTKVSDITTAVTTSLQSTGLAADSYTVSVTDSYGNPVANLSSVPSGSTFQVSISANWGTIGSGYRPMGLISTSRAITSSCVMSKEY